MTTQSSHKDLAPPALLQMLTLFTLMAVVTALAADTTLEAMVRRNLIIHKNPPA